MDKAFGSRFTPQEDTFLRNNYVGTDERPGMTAQALADKLGRPVTSTMNRLRELRLKKKSLDKPVQKKVSQFFDLDLVPQIEAGAKAADLSFSAYVQELVRAGLKKKSKAA